VHDFQDFMYNTNLTANSSAKKRVEVNFKFIYIAKVRKHAGQWDFIGLWSCTNETSTYIKGEARRN